MFSRGVMVPFSYFQTAFVQSHLASSCQSGALPNDLGDLVKQRLRQTTDNIDTDVISSVSFTQLTGQFPFVSADGTFTAIFHHVLSQ